MLTLSLPRGLGLMLVVAPCYRNHKTRRFFGPPKPRPKLACPALDRDLLDDAQTLYDTDNLIASAMTARVAIERELTILALSRPDFGEYWRGIFDTANWLQKQGVIRKKTHGVVIRASETGNAAAHGAAVDRYEVQQMFVAVRALRGTVARKAVTV